METTATFGKIRKEISFAIAKYFRNLSLYLLILFAGIYSENIFAQCGTTDHGGADWTPTNGSIIGGTHINVGTFTITSGYTVYVNPACNFLTVNAININVQGTISGNGAGNTGGSGGGAGTAYGSCSNSNDNSYSGGASSAGTNGTGTGLGYAGSAGGGASGYSMSAYFCGGNNGYFGGAGGAGGGGGGSYGGAGSGSSSGAGGVYFGQGDAAGGGGAGGSGGATYGTSSGTDITWGSGGGGAGGGGGGGGYSGTAGAAGGTGGGMVQLIATGTLTISGTISCNGTNGGAGGNGAYNSNPDWTCASINNCGSCSEWCDGSQYNFSAQAGAGAGAGGGAGGGIWLQALGVTNITGNLSAAGGTGGAAGSPSPTNGTCDGTADGGGGGGGGRIKIAINPCCSNTITPATANVNGGTGGVYYSGNWTSGGAGTYVNNITNPSYTALTVGTISSNQTICSNTSPAGFTDNSSPTGATGSYTYTWQYSTTSSTPGSGTWTSIPSSNSLNYTYSTALTTTTYFCCMITSGTCTAYTNAVTVSIVTTPSGGSISTVNYCASTGSASVSVTGVSNATQYLWALPSGLTGSSTGSSITISGTTPSTYTVTVTPQDVNGITCNGAQITGTVNVIANPSGGSIPTVNYCSSAGSAVVSVTGVSNATKYLWALPSGLTGSSISSSITVSGTTAGTYTVSVTPQDVNGVTCNGTQITGTVNIITTPSGGSISAVNFCASSGVSVSVTGVSNATQYLWALPTGLTGSSTGSSITVAGTTAGTYTVTVTPQDVSSTGTTCSETPILGLVTVNPFPAAAGTITGTAIVCLGQSAVMYTISPITYATSYTWAYSGTGFSIASGSGNNTIFANFSSSATSGNLTIYGVNSCGNGTISANYPITVNANNTAGTPSYSPTLCSNTALSPNITITTTGATGILNDGISGANGLPAGVSATWASNTITISGTPAASGIFNYSIPLTGGCGNAYAAGTITVTASNTAGLPSSSPLLIINTVMSPSVTIATTGATGISNDGVSGANGLPPGISASWSSNTITISGTPIPPASGTYNYSIPLIGGCGNINAIGSITVTSTHTYCGGLNTGSVTFNSGSGGTPNYYLSIDSGTTWTAYIPGAYINTAGAKGAVMVKASETGSCTMQQNIYTLWSIQPPAPIGVTPNTGDYVWTGDANTTTWETAGNWLVFHGALSYYGAGSPPLSSNNVLIATGTCISNAPSATTALAVCNNLSLSSTGTLTINNGEKLTVNGDLTNNGTITSLTGTGSIDIYGNWTNNNTFTAGIGTVSFIGSGTQTIGGSLASAFNNLIITNTSGSGVTLGTNIGVSGNWTNNGTFTPASNTVTFNGAAAQTIGGSHTTAFDYLAINNSGGAVNPVSLGINTTVNLNCALSTGALKLNGYTLTLNTNAANAIVGDGDIYNSTVQNGYILSNYVDRNFSSNIIWNINSTGTYKFPYGVDAAHYIPFTFTVNLTTALTNLALSTYQADPGNIGTSATIWGNLPTSPLVTNLNEAMSNSVDDALNVVRRFWYINPTASSVNADITFSYESTNPEVPVNGLVLNEMRAQRWNTSTLQWEYPPFPGTGQTSVTTTSPNTLLVQGVTNFSPWAITGEQTPLPVELISFTAKCDNIKVDLNWSTASETNNDYFSIDKSKDYTDWYNVGKVPGSGTTNIEHFYNTTDNSPYSGTSYYRLKQVDFNGNSKTYNPVATECTDAEVNLFEIINVYTNNSKNELTVVYNVPNDGNVNFYLINDIGQRITSTTYASAKGVNTIKIPLNNSLIEGIYMVAIEGTNNKVASKRIFIQ